MREKVQATPGRRLGCGLVIAAAAVALLIPATAGAAKIRYGIKSAELSVGERGDEHWGEGERHWHGAADFLTWTRPPGKQVGTLNQKAKFPRRAGFISVPGFMSGHSYEQQTEEGAEPCLISLQFVNDVSLRLEFHMSKNGKVVDVGWWVPEAVTGQVSCGGAFGGIFDEPTYVEEHPAAKFDNKTVRLADRGTFTQHPNELAEQEGVTGSRTVTLEGELVLRRLSKK